jgi:excisionase family DNA binding protein
MKALFSTSEVAGMLSVDESTVKRWSGSGGLACIKTKGGHRRFTLSSIMKFVQESNLQTSETAFQIFHHPQMSAQIIVGNFEPLIRELYTAALDGDIEKALTAARIGLTSKASLLQFYSDVFVPMQTLLENEFASGHIPAHQKHLAEKTIRSLLVRIYSDLHTAKPNGLTAVCASYENDFNEVPVDSAGLILSAQGWKVCNFGANLAAEQFALAIVERKADLAVLSATTIEDGWKFQNDIADTVAPAVRQGGGKLVVSGPRLTGRFGRKLNADYVVDSVVELAGIVGGFDRAT